MMVNQEILHQARLFLMAAATGIGMLFVYDLFRIFRRVAKHGTLWIAIEDMFFWVGGAFWLFRLMYRENDGIVRGFVILGVFLGMLLYNLGCSRWVVRGGTVVLRFLVKAVGKTGRFLLTPFRLAACRISPGIKIAGRFRKKTMRRMKKRLKKLCKAVKIGLCKL